MMRKSKPLTALQQQAAIDYRTATRESMLTFVCIQCMQAGNGSFFLNGVVEVGYSSSNFLLEMIPNQKG